MMAGSAAPISPQMQQRISVLTQAKAQGQQLDPQHEAEYQNYVKMGLAKSASPPKLDQPDVGDYHATMATIYKAMKQNDDWETQGAYGGITAHVPLFNTESKDFRSNIQGLRDHLSIDNLQKMRANSPTGGALGNVTEGEERLLANSTANLDPEQSPGARKRNITTVLGHFANYAKELGVNVPPPSAVQHLNQHPDLAKAFDEKYGHGVSQYYLDQQ